MSIFPLGLSLKLEAEGKMREVGRNGRLKILGCEAATICGGRPGLFSPGQRRRSRQASSELLDGEAGEWRGAGCHRVVCDRPCADLVLKRPQARMAQSGTSLIREWQGTAHRLTVLDDGVSFNGSRYRSLSEVAREITGSRWSGPRFFGLRSPVMENNHGTT